jgi:hypothetical protein
VGRGGSRPGRERPPRGPAVPARDEDGDAGRRARGARAAPAGGPPRVARLPDGPGDDGAGGGAAPRGGRWWADHAVLAHPPPLGVAAGGGGTSSWRSAPATRARCAWCCWSRGGDGRGRRTARRREGGALRPGERAPRGAPVGAADAGRAAGGPRLARHQRPAQGGPVGGAVDRRRRRPHGLGRPCPDVRAARRPPAGVVAELDRGPPPGGGGRDVVADPGRPGAVAGPGDARLGACSIPSPSSARCSGPTATAPSSTPPRSRRTSRARGPRPPEGRGLASVPVLFASEVTADELERWVGFVRFVRSVQVVPDTRGKDLDLLFDASRIRGRLARWFDEAARQAGERRVLVVVAGDGLRDDPEAAPLRRAHERVVRAPGVRYVRVQHAQSASLSWLRELAALVGERPDATVRFEAEHGSTVNVVLVGVAAHDPGPGLAAWDLVACGVVLSDLAGRGSHLEEVGPVHRRLRRRRAVPRARGVRAGALRAARARARARSPRGRRPAPARGVDRARARVQARPRVAAGRSRGAPAVGGPAPRPR